MKDERTKACIRNYESGVKRERKMTDECNNRKKKTR